MKSLKSRFMLICGVASLRKLAKAEDIYAYFRHEMGWLDLDAEAATQEVLWFREAVRAIAVVEDR